MPSSISSSFPTVAVLLSEKERSRQHPPEQIAQVYSHHQQQPQPELYVNQKEEEELKKGKNNNIFQPQIQPQMLPYHHNQIQQQQQQYLTTQQTSFSHGMALETTYNHTFQSLSIIDGGLTVAVDTSQNRIAVEEEMLKAASSRGSEGGVGKYHHQSHHLFGNDGLGFYDANGVDGDDMMASYVETNSMPIFDFGMPRNITARTGHTEAVIKCRVDRLDDKSVSWIRKRDLHILTVGTATYTSDKRFQVTESKDSREWTLHVKSPQARDSGIYECQVNTEPKMSMAFQLNVIEISPDAKAVITGPPDLHFKVGSAIILTCIIHQPSVKDIGPIYWYRGEYMITPFDINDNTHEENVVVPAVSTPGVKLMKTLTTTQNKVNVLEHPDVIYGGGNGNIDSDHMPQILTNEITQDFAQRIAMESQLGDTMKSRLRISNAQTSDTGNYTCQPTTASSASVMVHVINDENPAAMQKSGANSFHNDATKKCMLPLIYATMTASFVVLYKICGYCCYNCWLSSTVITTATTATTTAVAIFSRNCIMLTCCLCHLIYKNVLAGLSLLLQRRGRIYHQQHHHPATHNIMLIFILCKMTWIHLITSIMVSRVLGVLRAILAELRKVLWMVVNNLKAVNMPTLKCIFAFKKRNFFK